ncbi:MAG: GIY-YIG nuclease family protein [Marinoscillum sp.]|uniref:GIY-YIG nuclease family protein n=1 Tax=Marinoscillum sp. TaxID=2024838 RepID=UPI0033016979
MFYVYILKSIEHARHYTGMTSDLERRLSEHNSGKTKSTRAFKPWKLVYLEEYDTRAEARNREKYLKSGSGREWLKTKIASQFTSPNGELN